MTDSILRTVCDSILEPQYTAYIDMLCANLIVYDGIILPSAKELHVVMCNKSIDLVQLAKRIVRKIVAENLNNSKIRIGVLLDDKYKMFDELESEPDPESEHMHIITYKSSKPYDMAKSNYTAIIMIDPHPITNLDPATPLIVVSKSDHDLDRLKHKYKCCGKSHTIEYKIDRPYRWPDVMCHITNTNTDSDLTKLLNSIATKYRYPYYKILCITDDSRVKKLKCAFASNTQQLHPRMTMMVYDARQIGMFWNLNNMLYEKFCHDSHLKRTDYAEQSGILFASPESVLYYSPIELARINVVLLLNTAGLAGAKSLVSDVVEANRDTQQVLIVEPYTANLSNQIREMYECFYGMPANTNARTPKQRKLDAYTDILHLVKTHTIRCDVDLNESRLLKLQALYGVKPKDYDYINRHNIAYVITLIDTPNKMCSFKMYEAEDRYLHKNQIRTDSTTDSRAEIVTEQTDEITDDIPRWLGKSNGTEAVGSVLIFADEECNTAEYVRIVQIAEFSRKYKRIGWTEKENRDKKILFLSQIYKRRKLTELKKKYDKPKNKQFGYMEKLYL